MKLENLLRINVFIGSTEDIKNYRKHLITKFKERKDAFNSLTIEWNSLDWNKHFPAPGDIQENINNDIEKCDLVILILGEKIGEGIKKEIKAVEELYNRKKIFHYMLYFMSIKNEISSDADFKYTNERYSLISSLHQKNLMQKICNVKDLENQLFNEHLPSWIASITSFLNCIEINRFHFVKFPNNFHKIFEILPILNNDINEFADLCNYFYTNPDKSIIKAIDVKDISYTNEIIEINNRYNEKQLLDYGQKEYANYISQNMTGGNNEISYFLIAGYLYNKILEDAIDIFKKKEFIYPIHQHLSKLIRKSDKKEIIETIFKKWLIDKDNVYEITRNFAAFGIGMSGMDSLAGVLIKILCDEQEHLSVRYYSAFALGMIKKTAYIGELLKISKQVNKAELKKIISHVVVYILNLDF